MIKVKGSKGPQRKPRYLKNCLTCDEKFYVIYSLQRIKYCSHKCYWISKEGKPGWNKGKPNTWSTNEHAIGRTPWNKGKTIGSWGNHSVETRRKMSEHQKSLVLEGRHNFYRGGTTNERDRIENTFEYKEWRNNVFERDNWTCQSCYQRGGKLNADHIKSFLYYPELRFIITNGRTLCQTCHYKTDTYGSKVFNTKVQIGQTNVV